MLRWLADLEAVPVLLVDYLAGRVTIPSEAN
jgi:hypothetical protein